MEKKIHHQLIEKKIKIIHIPFLKSIPQYVILSFAWMKVFLIPHFLFKHVISSFVQLLFLSYHIDSFLNSSNRKYFLNLFCIFNLLK